MGTSVYTPQQLLESERPKKPPSPFSRTNPLLGALMNANIKPAVGNKLIAEGHDPNVPITFTSGGSIFSDIYKALGGPKIEAQIDRSVQDLAEVGSLGLHSYARTQKHRAADYQAQMNAQNRELAEYMANIGRQRADYSIIDSIMRSRRAVAMRSHRSQGILTSPLGAPIDQNKKMLLGQ